MEIENDFKCKITNCGGWGLFLRDFERENLGQVRGPEVCSKEQQTVRDTTKVWTCIVTEGLQTAGIGSFIPVSLNLCYF